jgi:hypothetical protein
MSVPFNTQPPVRHFEIDTRATSHLQPCALARCPCCWRYPCNLEETLFFNATATFFKNCRKIKPINVSLKGVVYCIWPCTSKQAANATYCIALWHLVTHPGDATGAFAAAFSWARTHLSHGNDVLEWLEAEAGASAHTNRGSDGGTGVSDLSTLEACSMIGFVKWGFCMAFHHLRARTPFQVSAIEWSSYCGKLDAYSYNRNSVHYAPAEFAYLL